MIQRSPGTAGCRFTGLKRGLSLQLAKFNKASGSVRSTSRNKPLLPTLPEEPSERLVGGPIVTVADSTPPTTRLTVTKPFSSPVSHPVYLIGSLATYSLIAFDVFAPNSLHLLQPIDQALHEATLANIDPEVRRTLFAGVFSNWWIISGAIGWIFTTATASVSSVQHPPSRKQPSSLLYIRQGESVDRVRHVRSDYTVVMAREESCGHIAVRRFAD